MSSNDFQNMVGQWGVQINNAFNPPSNKTDTPAKSQTFSEEVADMGKIIKDALQTSNPIQKKR